MVIRATGADEPLTDTSRSGDMHTVSTSPTHPPTSLTLYHSHTHALLLHTPHSTHTSIDHMYTYRYALSGRAQYQALPRHHLDRYDGGIVYIYHNYDLLFIYILVHSIVCIYYVHCVCICTTYISAKYCMYILYTVCIYYVLVHYTLYMSIMITTLYFIHTYLT